MGKLVMVGFQ
jgi:hypothetical protein